MTSTAYPRAAPLISSSRATTLASVGLFALICIATFYAANTVVAGVTHDLDDRSQSGDGNLVTQILFVGLFAATVSLILLAGRSSIFLRIPRYLVVTLAWSWLSLTWAIDPGSSFRRLAFVTLVILTGAYLVELLSYERLMRTLTASFAFIIVADWLAILIFPAATINPLVGMAWEGGWRGLHIEKNEAGAVCANCLILLLHETIRTKSWVTGPLLCLATALLLIQTHSKTSVGFVVVSLMLGAICSAAYRSVFLRCVTAVSFIALVLTAIGLSDLAGAQLDTMLDDPAAFTGRSQIWTVLTAYARDHLLLGAGYGSFWGIGDNSPVLSYGSGWLETVYQAHNGYLEMIINIGLIGLLFGTYDLVLRPLTLLASKPLPVGVSRSMLCAFVTFVCLHNLLEGTFMNRAAPTWVIATLVYASLFKSGAEAARSQREASYRSGLPSPAAAAARSVLP